MHPPTSAEQASQRHYKDILNNLWNVLVNRRGPWDLSKSRVVPMLILGQQGGIGEWQAGQSHLNPWGGDEAHNPANYFQTYEEQECG